MTWMSIRQASTLAALAAVAVLTSVPASAADPLTMPDMQISHFQMGGSPDSAAKKRFRPAASNTGAGTSSLTGEQRQQKSGLTLLPIGSDLVSTPPKGGGTNPPPPPKTQDDCMSCAD